MKSLKSVSSKTYSARLFLLVFLILFTIPIYSQDTLRKYVKYDACLSFAAGHKSQVGTFGIGLNYFPVNNLSFKIGLGHGASAYNGGLYSVGFEYWFNVSAKFNISISTFFTGAAKGFDMIGDEDSQDYYFYNTSKMRYWRSMFSLVIGKKSGFKINIGYSHALTGYTYFFSGPGSPTQNQINKIEKGLGSGLIVAFELAGVFNLITEWNRD